MLSNSLIELDRNHLIHPVMSWKGHEAAGAKVLVSGNGAYLKDIEGRELLDGFAGLWCVNVGYGQQSVIDAAAAQLQSLPYATGYFGFASEPAILLASRLANLSPGDLNHIFFTLGGSDAVDSAVRFIRYYYNVTGRPAKKHMIALDKGYHGSTTIGAGLTGLPSFHMHFDAPTSIQHHIPAPNSYRSEATDDATLIAQSVAALRAKVAELGAENVAAFFCEAVQGSGGVLVPPPGWLPAMRESCRELDLLFVADEVITGFGRTSPLFACETEGVVPDIMTVAKGLTSGYVPMGATFLSEGLYRAIADGTPGQSPVGHGFTYSAHPVSAAAGLAVLDLYEGGLLANGRLAGDHLAVRLARLRDHPLVGDVRSRGMLAGIELVIDKSSKAKPPLELDVPGQLSRIGYEKGVLFRSFADSIIGLAPPLSCSIEEVDLLMDRIGAVLDDVIEIPEVRASLSC